MLSSNIAALFITLGLAVLWLRLNDFAAHRGWISSRISRKIIHIGTGPIFVLCWLLFPGKPADRFLAALVPFAITLQFLLVGIGTIKDQAAVDAMSRSGDRREILRGPLFYGLAFVLLTLVFWTGSPVGIIGLMVLCGGDGLADLVGKRFGTQKIPWSKGKTWAGSMAVLLGGFVFSSAVLAIFLSSGVFPGEFADYLPGLALISFTAALVESLPLPEIDNLTVPMVCVALGLLFFFP
jgi:phytol kinase